MKEERNYRTPEQQVADLEAKIASIRQRAERKKAKAQPAVRFSIAAVKLIDKALAAAPAEPMEEALEQARFSLAQVVASTGIVLPPPTFGATQEVSGRRGRKVKTTS